MKSLSIATLLALVIVAQVSGQQLTDEQRTDQMRAANRKIKVGLILMGAGALAAPLTALSSDGDPGGHVMNASIGVMVLGSGVAWWGAMDRRRALQPQIAIGIGLGKSKSVRVTRRW